MNRVELLAFAIAKGEMCGLELRSAAETCPFTGVFPRPARSTSHHGIISQ